MPAIVMPIAGVYLCNAALSQAGISGRTLKDRLFGADGRHRAGTFGIIRNPECGLTMLALHQLAPDVVGDAEKLAAS
jgi:hypothetical protein